MLVSEAAEIYLGDLGLARSEKTVRTYSTALNHLIDFDNCDISELDTHRIAGFCRYLGQRGPSPSTMNTYLVAVTRFLRWLVMEELLDIDLPRVQARLQDFKMRIPERIPKVPRETDVQTLLEYVRNAEPGKHRYPQSECAVVPRLRWMRDRALLETLRPTGCRLSEALSLRVRDIDGDRALILGKGGKRRHLFWDEQAAAALHAYLQERGTDGAVFQRQDFSNDDSSITIQHARYLIKQWCWKAGVDEIRPHQFRHRFGTRVLNATNDLARTQDLMGHASPTTTRIYTRLTTTELKDAFDTVSL